MTWRLSDAGLLINLQSFGQSQRPLCGAFLMDRSWPTARIPTQCPVVAVSIPE